jgi:hypothetical protein
MSRVNFLRDNSAHCGWMIKRSEKASIVNPMAGNVDGVRGSHDSVIMSLI